VARSFHHWELLRPALPHSRLGPVRVHDQSRQGFTGPGLPQPSQGVDEADPPGNDVFDLERDLAGVFFAEVAVFAAATGPLADECTMHRHHHSRPLAARSWRTVDFKMATG
jgi:hypothetical protein